MSTQYFDKRPILGQVGGLIPNALYGIAAAYGDEVGAAAEAMAAADNHLTEGRVQEALQSAAKAQELFRKANNVEGTADAVITMINANKMSADLSLAKPAAALKLAKGELAAFKSKKDKLGEACMKLARAELNAHSSKKSVDQEAALTDAEEAYNYFSTDKNEKMQAFAQLVLVNIYIQKRRANDAMGAAASALDLFSAVNDKSGQAKALHGKALAFALGEDFANAVKSAQKAAALYSDLGQTQDQAFELSSVAHWQLASGKPHAAMEAARKAYGLVAGPMALGMMVEAAVASGRAAQAETLATEALRKFRTTDNAVEVVSAMALQIFAQCSGESPLDSLDTARDAIRTAQGYSNKELELNLLYTVCNANITNERHEAASKNMRDAAALARQLGDSSEEADALRMQAQAVTTMKDREEDSSLLDEAIEAAQSARALYNETGQLGDEASAIMTTSSLKSLADPGNEEVLKLAEEAEQLYTKASDVAGALAAVKIILEWYIAQGKSSEAMTLVDTLVGACKRSGHKKALAEANHALAGVLLMMGDIEGARETIQDGLDLCKYLGAKDLAGRLAIMNVQLSVGELSRNQGDSDQRLLTLKAAEAGVLAAKQAGDKIFYGVALTWRAQVLTLVGRGAEALQSSQMSENAFAQAGDKANQVRAAVTVSEILLALAKKEEAKAKAEAAIKLIDNDEAYQEDQGMLYRLLESMVERKPQMVESWDQGGQQDWGQQQVAQSAAQEIVPEKQGIDLGYAKKKVMELVIDVLADDGEVLDDSPFMEAGIDSLGSVQLLTDVGKAFGMALSPSAVFDYPSVRELAEHLVEESLQ